MSAVAREGTPADAIAGVVPRAVLTPASLDEAAEAMTAAARDRAVIGFCGGGTELELGAPPRRLDAVLRTEKLDRIVDHVPSDQIVVVEGGVRLLALQTALGAHGQRLAIDPPLAARATIGGLVATNAFGPRRARFGSLRDLIVGVTLIRADGVRAKSGGKVVKNVAGFDLPKLAVGSLGTLGLVASATFRLHPLPEASATLVWRDRTAHQVSALVRRARDAQLEPSAAVALGDGAAAGPKGVASTGELAFEVAVRFEGFAASVRAQREKLAALEAGAELLEGEAERALWERHEAIRTAGTLRLKLAAPPAALPKVAAQALPLSLSVVDGPAFAWYPTVGLGFTSGTPRGDAGQAAGAIAAARAAIVALGGSLVVQAAPAALRGLDAWGSAGGAQALLAAVKARLDPDGRLAPGRFVGGL